MSGFGVGLALAGASARGMRQGIEDINQADYTEKVRANNADTMQSNARMRPMEEAAQMNEIGVRNRQADATRQSLDDTAAMRDRTRTAMGQGWKEGKDEGLDFPTAYRTKVLPKIRDAFAQSDPVKAKEMDDYINSQNGEQHFQDWNNLNQALAGGDLKDATAAAQTALRNLYGKNSSFEQIETPDPANPGQTLPAWRVTGDGGVDKQLTPEQLQQTLQNASMTILAPHARFNMMLTQNKENAKSARDHAEKMAEIRKPIMVPEHGRITQFNQQTGRYEEPAAGGPAAADSNADNEIRATFVALMKGQMADLDPARQKIMAEGIRRAHLYLNNGAVDESGYPMSPGVAAAFAHGVLTGDANEKMLRYGQRSAQQALPATGAAPARSAADSGIPPALADPGTSAPIAMDGKTYRWGDAAGPDGLIVPGKRAMYEIQNGKPVPYQPTVTAPAASPAASPAAVGAPAAPAIQPPTQDALRRRAIAIDDKISTLTAKRDERDPYLPPGTDGLKRKAAFQRDIDAAQHERSMFDFSTQNLREAKQRFSVEALKERRASVERTQLPGPGRDQVLANLDKQIAAGGTLPPVAKTPNVERPIGRGTTKPTVSPTPVTTAKVGAPNVPRVETAKPTPETRAALQTPTMPRVMPTRPAASPTIARDIENPLAPSTTDFGTKPMAETRAALQTPTMPQVMPPRPSDIGMPPTISRDIENPLDPSNKGFGTKPMAARAPEQAVPLAAPAARPSVDQQDMTKQGNLIDPTPGADTPNDPVITQDTNPADMPAPNGLIDGRPNPGATRREMALRKELDAAEERAMNSQDETDRNSARDTEISALRSKRAGVKRDMTEKEMDARDRADRNAVRDAELATLRSSRKKDATAAYGAKKKPAPAPAAVGVKPAKAVGMMNRWREVDAPPAKGYIEIRPPGLRDRDQENLQWYRFADGTLGYTDQRWSPTAFYEMDPKAPLKFLRKHELKKPTFGSQQEAWTEFAKLHGLQGGK